MINNHPEAVLQFWFECLTPEQRFDKDEATDASIRREFFHTWQEAARGEWSASRERLSGRLAEIIVLDQCSRNLWRGNALPFVQTGTALPMTMMHSESLAIQDASLPLFKQHCDDNTYGFAMHHRDIVAEFGRFSHHNETLKRASTAAERAL